MGMLFGGKPKPPPRMPGLSETLQPLSTFIGPSEGTLNNTFITGRNTKPMLGGSPLKSKLGGA